MIASLDIWIDHGRLLYAAKALDKLKAENDDQRVGMEIVRKALVAPAKQIVVNAGADGSIVVGKLRDKGDPEWGYDAQTDQHVNMYKAGIIDPTKGVRTALQDAASVAGLIITTEAMVAERPKKESAGAPGGMGDMDYQGSRNSRRVRAAPWERPSCVGRPIAPSDMVEWCRTSGRSCCKRSKSAILRVRMTQGAPVGGAAHHDVDVAAVPEIRD